MTSDDSRRDTPQTNEVDQGGLPEDAGNQMSDRSEYTGESESGMTDTPLTTSDDTQGIGMAGTDAVTDTGTTFGTGGDDKGM
ncbi:hypothetical protein [Deinococcus apachensis]|uniref:hypothetical protein n=1 Tax=Deinococcus apachensis TaxID=309886 RepID=UPI00035F1B04|nr:hypothetical protein [Deinococcus apachensis]